MYVEKNTFQTFEECKFNRKNIVEKVIEPLLVSDHTNNITINGPYGYGKTTFLKMLSAYLVEKEYRVIFFNAWETDFISDPFLALYTEIITDKVNDADNQKFIKNIIKSTVFGSAKILTNLLPPVINQIASSGIEAIEGVLENETTEVLNEYRELKNDIIEFRKYLEKTIKIDDGKPIIFIIDELDRCKPTYSVALLERVKHLFNINGIKFIFGLDKQQLSYAVSSLYGQGMDSDGYLRRFFDIEYSLPSPDFTVLLDEKFNNNEFDGFLEDNDFKRYLSTILMKFDFSVRDFEKLSLRLRLINYEQYYKNFSSRDTIVTRFLLTLFKMKNEEMYNNIKNRSISSDVVRNEINLFSFEKYSNSYSQEFMYFIKGYLDYAYNDPNKKTDNIKHPNYEDKSLDSPDFRKEVHDTR